MDVMQVASEVFRALVLPPAGLVGLLVLGSLVGRRWQLAGKIIRRGALAVLVILCTAAGADLLVAPLEAMTKPLPAGARTGAQAIVVLAAGRMVNAPEYGGAHIPDYIALARLRYAARLQHETGLPLLVSGGNVAGKSPRQSKAADMASALVKDFKTPVTWIEGRSETTAQNAAYTAAMLKDSGMRRVLLVTDAMHMPRAQAVFQQSGLEVVAAPTMFFGLDSVGLLEFLPSAEALRRSYYASYEWIGIVLYRLRR